MINQYSAYTTASHMVRKTKQVVMLYEGAIKALQQAKSAIENNDIELRYNSLAKACDIITGLQLSLDHENGGEVSASLYDYYAGLDMRLMSIHSSNDVSVCDLCIKHLKMMKLAWEEIDQQSDIEAPEELTNFAPDLSNPEVAAPLAEAAASYNISA